MSDYERLQSVGGDERFSIGNADGFAAPLHCFVLRLMESGMYVIINTKVVCSKCQSESVEHVASNGKSVDRCRQCGHEGNHQDLFPRPQLDYTKYVKRHGDIREF